VWSVLPPLWRLRDLTGTHDLIEEIGRVHGFDRIEGNMPMADVRLPQRDPRIHLLRDALKAGGFFEIVPLSFLSAAHLASCELPPDDAITVQNPLGADTRYLQPSTLPRLLEHAAANLPRTEYDLLTFQWGHVFSRSVPEHAELSMLLTAQEEPSLLHDPFLRLKAQVETALRAIHLPLTVQKTAHPLPHMHPGRAADLLIGSLVIGHLFELHPIVRERTGLPFRSAAAQIDCTCLLSIAPDTLHARVMPSFPAVTYDVTVPRTQREPLGDLLQRLQSGSPLLESVTVQDLYASKTAHDPYQLTLRFVYRSSERTLTEEEAKAAHEGVLRKGGMA
jgi:phenylalanyl-tRNA synthetase beta chain